MLPRYADGSTGSRASKPKARKRSNSPSKERKRGKNCVGLIGCCMWTLVLVWMVVAVWFGSTVMLRDKPHDALLGPMILGPGSTFSVMWEDAADRVAGMLESRHPVPGYVEAQKSLAAYHFERGEYVNLIRQKGAELKDAAQKLFKAVPTIGILNSFTAKGANVMRAVGQKVGEKIGEKMAQARMDSAKGKMAAPAIDEAVADFAADIQANQASGSGDGKKGADEAAAAAQDEQAAAAGDEKKGGEQQAAGAGGDKAEVDAAGGAVGNQDAVRSADGAGDAQPDDKKSVGGEEDVDLVYEEKDQEAGGGAGERVRSPTVDALLKRAKNRGAWDNHAAARDRLAGRRGALSDDAEQAVARQGMAPLSQQDPQQDPARPPAVNPYKDNPRPWDPKKVAVVIMAHPHDSTAELSQTIDALRALPQAAQHDVYVSQDHDNAKLNAFIVKLQSTGAIRHIVHQTPDPSHLLMRERAAQHQRLAMAAIFSREEEYTHAIFVEDSIKFAPDFFDFFAAGAPIMDRDESVWCVSAWHTLGYNEMDWDKAKLMRTTHFSGIAWMATKELWSELSEKWPTQSWIEWMSQDSTSAGRSCVIPEVSRVVRVGNPVYSQQEARYERFNAKVRLSDLPSEKMTFMDTAYILKQQYDAWLSGSVRRARIIDNPMRAEVPANSFGPFLLEYDAIGYPLVAHKYGLPDTPLGDYEGLTLLKLKGNLMFLVKKGSRWTQMKNDMQ